MNTSRFSILVLCEAIPSLESSISASCSWEEQKTQIQKRIQMTEPIDSIIVVGNYRPNPLDNNPHLTFIPTIHHVYQILLDTRPSHVSLAYGEDHEGVVSVVSRFCKSLSCTVQEFPVLESEPATLKTEDEKIMELLGKYERFLNSDK